MPRSGNVRGILSMLMAIAFFSLMDAGLKWLSAFYPPMQVAALRGLSSLPLVSVWVFVGGNIAGLWRVRWSLHLLRGALSVLMLGSFTYALARLPLAEAYSIFFVAPALVTALSVPLLGERVGPRRWTAIAVGLLGVLVVLRPTGQGVLSIAGLAVLVSASAYALSAIAVRVLHRTDSGQSMVFWMLVMLSLGASLLAWPNWVAINWAHWPVLVGLGLVGFLGQIAITEAFRHGQASVVAPFEYSALAWGLGLDWLLWGVLPDAITYVGAAIIIASGLYLLRRESEHAEAEHP